ncbi:sensor histidine kinase [Marinifilum sp. D737]|uniref:sensor histidine kinase n=1 Tax=Marinifilum sp. D737 TaxID=2969628 RepID=UPI002272C908|nr:ATP-binding protein [Marinifilum sp. D737]MCY1635341.1 ATP-binding protein [Marinifilum sp. D737]
MIYRRFYIGIIIQVILISLTPVLFLYVHSKEYMVVTTYSLVVLWVLQIVYLLHYVNKTNRDLSRFFDAFQYQDATLVFNEQKKDKAFKNLHQSFNHIINAFGKVKIEKEKDFIFFQHTLELVGIGLLAFDKEGNVKLCNPAFKELFLVEDFLNISELECIDKEFPDFLERTKSGKQKLRNYLVKNRILKLAVKATSFRLEDEQLKVVAFQDIKNAVDKGEMDAMHKLIRVFAHEITNSVSPISMLSGSLIELYQNDKEKSKDKFVDEGTISNTIMGLTTIRKRSKGLLAFVDEYKNLTHLPKPHFKLVPMEKLFFQIETLFKEEFKAEQIEFTYHLQDKNQELIADEKLITQVLINLVRNAIDALKETENKTLFISTGEANPVNFIIIRDNGIGIPEDVIDNVFTPFFTTKEKGSGIGLNLSRQIMRLHSGTIAVRSKPNCLTEFTLQF